MLKTRLRISLRKRIVVSLPERENQTGKSWEDTWNPGYVWVPPPLPSLQNLGGGWGQKVINSGLVDKPSDYPKAQVARF